MEDINPADSNRPENAEIDSIETPEDPNPPGENTDPLAQTSTNENDIIADVGPNEEDERSEIDIDFEIAKAAEREALIEKTENESIASTATTVDIEKNEQSEMDIDFEISKPAEIETTKENEPLASTAAVVDIAEDERSEIDIDFEIAKAAEREATIETSENEAIADSTTTADIEPNKLIENPKTHNEVEVAKSIESETTMAHVADAGILDHIPTVENVPLSENTSSPAIVPADIQTEEPEPSEIDTDFKIANATESEATVEKCDDEPMDIDEILDSLNTDQDVVSSSEGIIDDLQCRVEEPSLASTTLGNENATEPNGEEIEEREKNPPPIEQTEEELTKDDELKSNSAHEIPVELPTSSSVDDALNNVVGVQKDNPSIDLEDQPAQQQEGQFLPDVEKTSQNDLETVNSLVVENDSNEVAIVNEIEDTNEVSSSKIEQTSETIQETPNDKDDKNEKASVADSVDVFDLLLENQDLFGQTEENEGEQQKLEDFQTETNSENGTENNVETNKIVENVENIVEKATEKAEPMEVQTEKTLLRRDCLNVDCLKESAVFYEAPEFVISHFHLNKPQKTLYVCEYCYDFVTEAYGDLCGALMNKQPLFYEKVKYTDLVEIIDSSDEDDDDDGTGVKNDKNRENRRTFDEKTLALIENELESVIAETFDKVNIEQQMDWNRQILTNQIHENEKNCKEMMNEMKTLQHRIDKLYANTYNFRHSFIEEVQSLDLQTLKPTQICNESYPPNGELQYSDIEYNSMYYTFRKKLTTRWLPCKVIDKVQKNGTEEYVVKFCREDLSETKVVPRKHLAYAKCPAYRLNIGVRVIALYDYSRDSSLSKRNVSKRNNFLPGIIAEPLCKYTKWRYLIFFDYGYVQYVHHENIRVICAHTDSAWDLIEEPGAKAFIEDYTKDCRKKRPFVTVKPGNRIQTELDKKWYNAIVNEVVVQMYFEDLKRYDWVYRASTRLFPLFKRLKHAKTSADAEPIIEYIEIDDDKEPERSTEPPSSPVEESPQPETSSSKTTPVQRTFASQAARDTPQQKQREHKRAVAKKSTGNQPKPTIQHMNNSTIYVDEDKPKGKVVYFAVKKPITVKKYVNHECHPGCLVPVQNLASYSPLSKALLSGFERQICKTRYNKNKHVVYRAPCGRRLRDMYEMHKYLRMTNCKLNVDNFSFDPLIHCLAEYMIESHVMKKPDLSEGTEKMPVQLVNCYDGTMPPSCVYSAKRIPTEGVNLNLDPEFLCGCDCTDDCLDKSKCACWKLTLAGAKYGNPETPIEDVGYEYKRLNEPVPTGIYECNSRCKCKSNCLNRVVQHPLQLKLQVFKTVNRGWGLRCLNDVPKGSFICCYAGNLLTEASANEAGEDLGDEYFAELDYIEVVENMKEGYEPEVINEDPESSSNDEDFDVEMESMREHNDDSDDEFVARSYTASEDSESRRYRTRNSVDTRKKPDQNPPKGVEKRKDRSSLSDDDDDEEVRQVKSFMASNTMPLNDDPDEEPSKSIRKFFGKNEAVYIMDAKKAGNIGRYFNHSCGPNLFVQNVFVDTHDLRFPWVAFFASTHIRAGTELTWNYNYEVGSVPGKVLICQCGDEKCRGRIL